MTLLIFLGMLCGLLLSGVALTALIAWRISTRSVRYKERPDD